MLVSAEGFEPSARPYNGDNPYSSGFTRPSRNDCVFEAISRNGHITCVANYTRLTL